MEYKKTKNKIIIKDLADFNIKHILECGQVFYYEHKNDYYEVISGSELARIFTYENQAVIECTNADYFENYFDLKTDYAGIKEELSEVAVLKNAISYAYGMRILRQEKLQTIIAFIISANNNIKRIQNSIKLIASRYGAKINSVIGEFYAFPTLEQLNKITVEDFLAMGVGYRAPYLVKAIKELNFFDFNLIETLPTTEAVKKLTVLSGIGPKVADCILLFSYHKGDVVPVDTWMEKVYLKYFSQNTQIKNRIIMRNEFVATFKNLSGYAQQYLFYYEREFN